MFVLDQNDINGTGNGDLCVRTDKGTLVALIFATCDAQPNLERAQCIVNALNAAFSPGHTDLMLSPEDIDAFLDANPPPPCPVPLPPV